ncbi:hypothetical protein IB258_02190 [Achromobacter sp. ACM02]|uniref:hypothetical protein n=1 Tax=Achromobacter sp. ACM02 TaxID=2769305 RepID=UPI001784151E|nr:hypothetical protein [Achromobacter sp. ACM02]MBD9380029.1 hypothetical protein [Achromobacter sp. ACM02]
MVLEFTPQQVAGLCAIDAKGFLHGVEQEALVPGFYEQPGFLAWIRKPGRPADQRFHDYMQVMKWQSRQRLQQEQRE